VCVCVCVCREYFYRKVKFKKFGGGPPPPPTFYTISYTPYTMLYLLNSSSLATCYTFFLFLKKIIPGRRRMWSQKKTLATCYTLSFMDYPRSHPPTHATHATLHYSRHSRYSLTSLTQPTIYIYIYIHTHTYIHIYKHTHTQIHSYKQTYVYIYNIHTCVHIIYICIYIHTYIHTYIKHYTWETSDVVKKNIIPRLPLRLTVTPYPVRGSRYRV
jgi:hypothetical protein